MHPASAFCKSAARLNIGPLERVPFVRFLKRKFRSGGRSAAAAVLEMIIDRAFDVPGDVQRLCEAIWDATDEGEKISELTIDLGIHRVFCSERRSFEAYLTGVTGQQMDCLRALAECRGSSNLSAEFIALTGIAHSSSVQRAMNSLVKKGILFRSGTDYCYCDPFLGQWILSGV